MKDLVGRTVVPKDMHGLIPRTCGGMQSAGRKFDMLALQGKRDFAHVIKLRALIQGDYLGCSGWVQVIRVLVREDQSRCQATSFEDGRRGYMPRYAGGFEKLVRD